MRRLTGQGYGPQQAMAKPLFEMEMVRSRATGRTGTVESAGDSPTNPWDKQRSVVTDASELTPAEYQASTNWYNVMEYGAKGDGATDDTAAIQDAIDAANAAGGGVVFFPVGTYLALSLAGKSGVALQGVPGAVLRKNGGGATTHIIDWMSASTGSPVSGTLTDAVGDTVLDFPGTGNFASGDYALLYDSTFEYSTLGRNQEIVRVASVAAATVTVREGIIRTYLLANSPKLQLLDIVKNVRVHGLEFEVPVGTSGGCIYFNRCTEVEVSSCRFRGADEDPAVYITESSFVWVHGCYIEDTQTQTSGRGYAVTVASSSNHVLVSDCYMRNIRECNVSDGCRHVAYIGNVIQDAEASGINTHGSGNRHVLIANNHVVGAVNSGIAVGHSTCSDHDEDVMVIGNKVELSEGNGITVDCDTDTNLSITVANNMVYHVSTQVASKYGISIRNSNFVAVMDNWVEPVDADANGGIIITDCDDAAVVGNYICNVPVGVGIVYQGVNDSLLILRNMIRDVSSYNVQDASAGSTTNARCEHNWSDDVTVSIGAGTRRVRNSFDNIEAVSSNRGDANVTLVIGTDAETQRFSSTLTANRTVTLPATGYDGAKFRIVRTGLGAFTLDVGGLKTIPNSTAAFVDVQHDGTAWRLTGYGTL